MKRRSRQPERPAATETPRSMAASYASRRKAQSGYLADEYNPAKARPEEAAAARPPELNEADKVLRYIEKLELTSRRHREQHAAQA